MNNCSDDDNGIIARFAGWLVVIGKGKPAIILAVALSILAIVTVPLYLILTKIEGEIVVLLVIMYFGLIIVVLVVFGVLCESIINSDKEDG